MKFLIEVEMICKYCGSENIKLYQTAIVLHFMKDCTAILK